MAQEESDADEVQEMLELASHYERHATGINQAKPDPNVQGGFLNGYMGVCVCVFQVCCVNATRMMKHGLRCCWCACRRTGEGKHACS